MNSGYLDSQCTNEELNEIVCKHGLLQYNIDATNGLLTTEVMPDNDIIWGVYEIIGNKCLEESDIDFPMQFGFMIKVNKKTCIVLHGERE